MECLDEESSSGDSSVPQVRSIGHVLSNVLCSFRASSVSCSDAVNVILDYNMAVDYRNEAKHAELLTQRE
jgi:hypothetical protein